MISLNMAGSVPDAADLVVTDPVQAGVMAVMAVADTAKFNIQRLKRRSINPGSSSYFHRTLRICQLFLYPIQCRGVVIADERLFLAVVLFGPAFRPKQSQTLVIRAAEPARPSRLIR